MGLCRAPPSGWIQTPMFTVRLTRCALNMAHARNSSAFPAHIHNVETGGGMREGEWGKGVKHPTRRIIIIF